MGGAPGSARESAPEALGLGGRDAKTAAGRQLSKSRSRVAPQAVRPVGPILRKEVIQPQVPLRLPCYDFTPVADLTVVGCLPTVQDGEVS